jgi:hypothetical protein
MTWFFEISSEFEEVCSKAEMVAARVEERRVDARV